MERLTLLIMLALDLLVLWKLLDVKETARPTAKKVVNIDNSRIETSPIREQVPARYFPQEVEEETFEDLKEAFRLKIQERRKAWLENEIFNVEENLLNFQLKNGLLSEEEVYNKSKNNFNNGLFSLRTV